MEKIKRHQKPAEEGKVKKVEGTLSGQETCPYGATVVNSRNRTKERYETSGGAEKVRPDKSRGRQSGGGGARL